MAGEIFVDNSFAMHESQSTCNPGHDIHSNTELIEKRESSVPKLQNQLNLVVQKTEMSFYVILELLLEAPFFPLGHVPSRIGYWLCFQILKLALGFIWKTPLGSLEVWKWGLQGVFARDSILDENQCLQRNCRANLDIPSFDTKVDFRKWICPSWRRESKRLSALLHPQSYHAILHAYRAPLQLLI